MSRAALRSSAALAGVAGLMTTGLLNAAAAGATEPCVVSAEAASVTCTYTDTGEDLRFLVPEGVQTLDITVRSGQPEGQAPDADASTVIVTPGSTLVIDLGDAAELRSPLLDPDDAPAAPDGESLLAPWWYLAPGNGAAALIRVTDSPDPTEGDVASEEEASIPPPADDAPVEASLDGAPVVEEAAISIVLTFPVPVPAEGEEPTAALDEWPRATEPADQRTETPAAETPAAENATPAASETSAPAAPATSAPAAPETSASAAPEAPAPVDTWAAAEEVAAIEAPPATEPLAPMATEPPAAVAADTPTPVAVPWSARVPAAAPATSAPLQQPAQEVLAAGDLQIASSVTPSSLLDADGAPVFVAALGGVFTLAIGVILIAGMRRRD